METGDISAAQWTYEKADRIPGEDRVTLYFHRTDNFSTQTKVTVNDRAHAVAWAADRGFPDPGAELDQGQEPNGVLRT